MCLSTVDKDPKYRGKIGYKVVRDLDNGLVSEFSHGIQRTNYPIGVWVTDQANYYINEPTVKYPTGFHIFSSLGMARAWSQGLMRRIVRVEFQDVVATGHQRFGFTAGRCRHTARVIVARRIKVLGLVPYE